MKKKTYPAFLRIAIAMVFCALPYAVLPPLCEVLPEEIVWIVSFILCHALLPVSALIAPYALSRRGIPAIAAWPWPLVGALILPLWGLRTGTAATVVAVIISIISAVTGEEVWRRETDVRKETPHRKRKRRR